MYSQFERAVSRLCQHISCMNIFQSCDVIACFLHEILSNFSMDSNFIFVTFDRRRYAYEVSFKFILSFEKTESNLLRLKSQKQYTYKIPYKP